MTPRSITLQSLAQRLSLSEELLKEWMRELSVQGSRDQGGLLTLDPWEAEFLTQAKDFYVGYQRDFGKVREALTRWASRHPKPEPPALSPDDDLLDIKPSSDSELKALPELPAELLSGSGERPNPTPSAAPSRPPAPRRRSPSTQRRAESAPAESAPTESAPTESAPPASLLAESAPSLAAPSLEEVNRWKSHFQNAQRDLRRAQEELSRARDKQQQQHAAIKQLQADFNALKELMRKEIYDLRDLVVDKQEP